MDISRKQQPIIATTRSGKLSHNLQPIEELDMADENQFASVMAKLSGGLFLEEAQFLADLASRVQFGCIVEVGSFRGKSSVALSHGAKLGQNNINVYCIEPHQPFTGIYGGKFGPVDRGEYYRAMLATGAYKNTSLINLSSEKVTVNWSEKVSLCFIDGDHTYEAVKRDWNCWFEHIAPGGIVVFDDAKDPDIGPSKLVQEILQEHEWELIRAPKKFIALQRPSTQKMSSAITPVNKNILVLCEKVVVTGGLLRFERLAKEMALLGTKLAIVELDTQETKNANPLSLEHLNLISFDQAKQNTWDAVMIPGAGFSSATIDKFSQFNDLRFGVRIQHILNDQLHRDKFLAVNQSFAPDMVIFNNPSWPVGSYTDFKAKQFHELIGAVDVEFFHDRESNSNRNKGQWIVGGQAHKHADVLIKAIERLPSNIHLKLFGGVPKIIQELGKTLQEDGRLEYMGYLDDDGLLAFYSSLKVIVSTENSAGWANICAEAAACGVPIVCTEAGTRAFAEDGKTARVIKDTAPETIAHALQDIIDNPHEATSRACAARVRIENYSFSGYAKQMLTLLNTPPKSHYVRAPELGLFGKWALKDRLTGLDALFELCSSKTILDLGAAEGTVSLSLLKHAAAKVTGFEFDEDRVEFANMMLERSGFKEVATIHHANLIPWNNFIQSQQNLLSLEYDIVLYLGIHHHLGKKENRVASLTGALTRAKELFAIRTPQEFWEQDKLLTLITDAGWTPLATTMENQGKEYMGGLVIFKKSKHNQFKVKHIEHSNKSEQ